MYWLYNCLFMTVTDYIYIDNIRTFLFWKNKNLYVRSLETGRKTCIWWVFLPCFTASANEFYIFRRLTYMQCLYWYTRRAFAFTYGFNWSLKSKTFNGSLKCRKMVALIYIVFFNTLFFVNSPRLITIRYSSLSVVDQ